MLDAQGKWVTPGVIDTHSARPPGKGLRDRALRRSERSLEPGKNADVVIWSGDPFSVYSRAEQVFVDGAVVFDRGD